jgi:RNA polymerase sigma-70 factor, ECF subfamily
MADSLSMAFLVLLESLSPVERAVFLLRDVFDYGYDAIASTVGKSEDNCRQIAMRARRQLEAKKPRFEASRRKREELSRRFFDAVSVGDADGLLRLLAADVVMYGDGGGEAPSVPRPIYGRDRLVRLFLKADRVSARLGFSGMRHEEVNGQPGAVFVDSDGRPVLVVSLDIVDGFVQTVHSVSNPDKLRHLYPGADVRRPSD